MDLIMQLICAFLLIILGLCTIDIELFIHQFIIKAITLRENSIRENNGLITSDEDYAQEKDFYNKKIDTAYKVCLILSIILELFISFNDLTISILFSCLWNLVLNAYTIFIVFLTIHLICLRLKQTWKIFMKIFKKTPKE